MGKTVGLGAGLVVCSLAYTEPLYLFLEEEEMEERLAEALSDSALSSVGLGGLTSHLEYELTVEGVVLNDTPVAIEEGRFTIYLPKSIDRISMENIRIGDTDTSLGSFYMTDITWGSGSKLTIVPRDNPQ